MTIPTTAIEAAIKAAFESEFAAPTPPSTLAGIAEAIAATVAAPIVEALTVDMPAACVYLSSSYTLPTKSAWTKVSGTYASQFNYGGLWNAAGKKMVAPHSGIYHLNASLLFQGHADQNVIDLAIYNATKSSYLAMAIKAAASASQQHAKCSSIKEIDEGDEIDIRYWTNGSGTQTVGSGSIHSFFEMRQIA